MKKDKQSKFAKRRLPGRKRKQIFKGLKHNTKTGKRERESEE